MSTGELDDYLQRSVPYEQAALAVAGASGIVRAHCQWDISREENVVFKLNGSGTPVLSLPTLQLTAVHAVTVNGEAVDSGDYRWARRGQIYRTTNWSRWDHIDAEVDSGYTATPDVVRIVALSLAARIVSNPNALKSATVGAVQYTYPGAELNRLEMSLLDKFRLP